MLRRTTGARHGLAAGIFLIGFLLLDPAILSACSDRVAGYSTDRIRYIDSDRPIHLDFWYPASAASASEKPFNYRFGRGQVANGVEIADGPHPAVVLSHGAFGSANNYSWIAEHLARCGILVMGVSHFGESMVYGPDTIDPAAATRLWDRANDVSRALDFLLEESKFRATLSGRIGALGHSSGGATAIALAGARFSPKAISSYCASSRGDRDLGCTYGGGDGSATEALATASYRDERISAIAALDPALGPGYEASTLADLDLPTLVVGATDNDFLPFEFHAEHYAASIPGAELVRIGKRAGHFAFLDECYLTVRVRGVPLCEDRDGAERREVHEDLKDPISAFFLRTLR